MPIAFARSTGDRKSTRLNSSHRTISYAVFCSKKKMNRPGKNVTLLLNSYEPVHLQIRTVSNTVIERVILAGYYRQTFDGLASNLEFINAFYDAGHGSVLPLHVAIPI